MSSAKTEASARDRLLAAANELFYEEGVHTVGIDRVIERAGVAKASLYSAFGSKEELVRAYLQARADARMDRITRRLSLHDDPRARILAVFDLLGDLASDPKFRGCAFVNASAEGSRGESKVRQVCLDTRAWVRGLFADLARELGAKEPGRLGRQLALLYDGATIGASMERDAGVVNDARMAAEALLDAYAIPTKGGARPRANGKRTAPASR
ncbi:MAG TPA: helix-turn-helix domain-containing protein [Polyangiaceae bacterium]|jgi:AcrR family transcriptional regulator